MAHRLLRSQENEVLQAIVGEGLDPHDFEWMEVSSRSDAEAVPMLVRKDGEGFFAFEFDAGRRSHVARYSPDAESPERWVGAGAWESQLGYVRRWLAVLRREIGEPDLWGQIASEGRLTSTSTSAENTPFTAEEQAQIATELREVGEYVRATFELTQAQHEEIQAQLEYLIDAASRSRRNDWRMMMIGIFLSKVVNGVLPQEPVGAIINLSLRALSAMFGVDVPELPEGGGPPATLS